MLILIGRGLDLRKPTIVRKEDSRSILCGFEGADDGSVKRGSEAAETKRKGSVKGRSHSQPNKISGDNSWRVPPVPIPNTEVKPPHADGTWLETARESRSSPDSIQGRFTLKRPFLCVFK